MSGTGIPLRRSGLLRWEAWVAMAVVLASGCAKPESDLGLDLLPGTALGNEAVTTPLHAYTFRDTAIRTSGLTRNLLGSYLDPQFGLVRTGIVAQLRLSSNNVGAGQDVSGLVADSLVLALAYDGINYAYGNLHPQVFRVHELAEALFVDSVYRADDVPMTVPDDLVAVRGGRITPEPNRNAIVGGDTLQPQLRIRLTRELADRFLSRFGTSDLADNTAFLEFFKGLHITVDNGPQLPFQQGLLYFSLLNGASKATLYYRDLNVDPEATLQYDFVIGQNAVRYTTVEHVHDAAPDQRLPLALADTSQAAANVFLQAMGGVRTMVRFPEIMQFAERGRALARAELVMAVDGTFNPFLPPPAQLFVFRKDDEGNDAFLPDQTGGIGAIDGNYRASTAEYRFNITRYVINVLKGTLPNRGVVLVPASNGITGNRVVLAGPEHPQAPMRLELTFTTY